MSLKVLVIGATGHIGRSLVESLIQNDHEVTALTRSQSTFKLSGLKLPIEVTESPIDFVESSAQHFNWVIDAAAPYPLELFVPSGYYQEAEARQTRIIEACKNGDTGLCYISSFVTVVSADTAYQRIKRRSSPYYVLKKRLEGQVLNARKSGLKSIIINPTTVIGPGDHRENSLVKLIAKGEIPIAIETELNVIDVRDLARLVTQLLAKGETTGPMLVGGYTTKVSSLLDLIEIKTGERPILVTQGQGLIAAATTAFETLMQSSGVNTPVPTLLTYLMTEKIPSDMPSYSETPLSKTLEDSLL